MEFIISLILFIISSCFGAFISTKIPKIDIHIPEPVYMIIGFGIMCAAFYLENDRILQIAMSFISGLCIGYLHNCQDT